MGRVFCIVGKSSVGKDTIYKRLLENQALQLKQIVPYTTRPIRAGEHEGVEYHFTTVEMMERMLAENRIIECRAYDTVYGIWYYFMAKDAQIDLAKNDYLMIGTLDAYIKIRDYFGSEHVMPIYINLDDGERLSRALEREKRQPVPMYEEMCRRYLADAKDFSQERLDAAGITKSFDNNCLENCLKEIEGYIIMTQ